MQCELFYNLIQFLYGTVKYDTYYGFNEDCLKLKVFIVFEA